MAYEISVQETIWTKTSIGSNDLRTTLQLMEAVGPNTFSSNQVQAALKHLGSYTYSNGNKMITIKYVSDFKGQ